MKNYKNKRELGGLFERQAEEFLLKEGYKIIRRNFSTKFGEIDIIASDGKTLCFVEVKGLSGDFISPLVKVNGRKQKKIISVAKFFIKKEKPPFENFRFDVVGISQGKVEIVKGAYRIYG